MFTLTRERVSRMFSSVRGKIESINFRLLLSWIILRILPLWNTVASALQVYLALIDQVNLFPDFTFTMTVMATSYGDCYRPELRPVHGTLILGSICFFLILLFLPTLLWAKLVLRLLGAICFPPLEFVAWLIKTSFPSILQFPVVIGCYAYLLVVIYRQIVCPFITFFANAFNSDSSISRLNQLKSRHGQTPRRPKSNMPPGAGYVPDRHLKSQFSSICEGNCRNAFLVQENNITRLRQALHEQTKYSGNRGEWAREKENLLDEIKRHKCHSLQLQITLKELRGKLGVRDNPLTHQIAELEEKLKVEEEKRKRLQELGFSTHEENKQLKAEKTRMEARLHQSHVRLISAESKLGSLTRELADYKNTLPVCGSCQLREQQQREREEELAREHWQKMHKIARRNEENRHARSQRAAPRLRNVIEDTGSNLAASKAAAKASVSESSTPAPVIESLTPKPTVSKFSSLAPKSAVSRPSAPTPAASQSLTLTPIVSQSLAPKPETSKSSAPASDVNKSLALTPIVSQSLAPKPEVSQSSAPASSVSQSLVLTPIVSQSLAPKPETSKSSTPASAADKSLTLTPIVSQSLAPKPEVFKSLKSASTVDKSVAPKPTVSQTLAPKPAVLQSLAPKPEISKSLTSASTVDKPVAPKPATSQSLASTSSAPTSTVDNSVVFKPAVFKFPVPKSPADKSLDPKPTLSQSPAPKPEVSQSLTPKVPAPKTPSPKTTAPKKTVAAKTPALRRLGPTTPASNLRPPRAAKPAVSSPLSQTPMTPDPTASSIWRADPLVYSIPTNVPTTNPFAHLTPDSSPDTQPSVSNTVAPTSQQVAIAQSTTPKVSPPRGSQQITPVPSTTPMVSPVKTSQQAAPVPSTTPELSPLGKRLAERSAALLKGAKKQPKTPSPPPSGSLTPLSQQLTLTPNTPTQSDPEALRKRLVNSPALLEVRSPHSKKEAAFDHRARTLRLRRAVRRMRNMGQTESQLKEAHQRLSDHIRSVDRRLPSPRHEQLIEASPEAKGTVEKLREETWAQMGSCNPQAVTDNIRQEAELGNSDPEKKETGGSKLPVLELTSEDEAELLAIFDSLDGEDSPSNGRETRADQEKTKQNVPGGDGADIFELDGETFEGLLEFVRSSSWWAMRRSFTQPNMALDTVDAIANMYIKLLDEEIARNLRIFDSIQDCRLRFVRGSPPITPEQKAQEQEAQEQEARDVPQDFAIVLWGWRNAIMSRLGPEDRSQYDREVEKRQILCYLTLRELHEEQERMRRFGRLIQAASELERSEVNDVDMD